MKKQLFLGFYFTIVFTLWDCLSNDQFSLQEIFEIGKKAYIYAYPLVVVDLTKRIMTNVSSSKDLMRPQAQVNQFAHVPIFPDERFTAIVRPNIDTLYSFAWLDLQKEPIVMTMPNTRGRYYVAEVLDAWTNVFASLGKRTTGTCESSVAFIGPWWKGDLPKGMKRIQAPTNLIWILLRIQTNGKKDYTAVHDMQNGFKVIPLSQWKKKSIQQSPQEVAAKFDATIDMKTAPVDQVAAMEAVAFFTTFAHALKKNPPLPDDAAMVALLKKIGIVPGKDFDVESLPEGGLLVCKKQFKQHKKRSCKNQETLE